MGEAKRRKQALGDRYGKTPPVLVDGSRQLEEHAERFREAFCSRLNKNSRELAISSLERTRGNSEHTHQAQSSNASNEMDTWLINYLEPYRAKDREKLALCLLAPMHLRMYLDDLKAEKKDKSKTCQILVELAMCLVSFNFLKRFVSEENQKLYKNIFSEVYAGLKTEVKGEISLNSGEDKEDKVSFSQFFHHILDREAAPV